MAWGDTCGKIKLCLPKSVTQLCWDGENWGGNFNVTFRDFTLPGCFIIQSGTNERINDIPITFDGSTSVPVVLDPQGAAYTFDAADDNTPEIAINGASATVQFPNGEYGTIIYAVTDVDVFCRDSIPGGEGKVNVAVNVRKFTAEHATASPPRDLSAYTLPNPAYVRSWIAYEQAYANGMVDFNGGLIEIEDADISSLGGEYADYHPPASPYYITWDLT